MKATRYDVSVGGTPVSVEADADGRICLAGSGRTADIVRVDDETWSVLLGDRAYTIHAHMSGGVLRMRGRGPSAEVAVASERRRLLQLAGASAAKTEHGTSIVAPMPALVVRIEVEVGQEIAAGQGVVVLEAMKMENEIRAPRAGRVVAVHARAAHPVEKGEVLVILE